MNGVLGMSKPFIADENSKFQGIRIDYNLMMADYAADAAPLCVPSCASWPTP